MVVNDILISQNFKLSEFESRDTNEVKIYPELVQKTQRIRDIIRLPLRINSGYRTPERNQAVGGVPNSLHCQGKAVDLSCAFVSLAQLTVAAIMAGFHKVIVYSKFNFIHCDLSDVREYLVPTDWVPWLALVFPEYANSIKAWSEVQGPGKIEL
jgi:uncharacterized protein YcbK (DUF882 family)